MEQLLIIVLAGTAVCLYLQGKHHSHTPNSSETKSSSAERQYLSASKATKAKRTSIPEKSSYRNLAVQTIPPTKKTNLEATKVASLNTGIPELDGPGMYHRIHGCGPSGHVCYLLYSAAHKAYKVGICEPNRLGIRLKTIKQDVPDLKLAGTAVFTSRQNAFNAEQKVIAENKQYRYRGINGTDSGRSEWFTRGPTSGRPYFTSPEKVERTYQEDLRQPTQNLVIPDNYTIYLAHSQMKNSYIAKWCKSDNLQAKIKALMQDAPDVKIVSRMPIERHEKARQIAKKLNEDNGTFEQRGRYDQVAWSSSPNYLNAFRNWDSNGNRIS